jgi:hypothetical protein
MSMLSLTLSHFVQPETNRVIFLLLTLPHIIGQHKLEFSRFTIQLSRSREPRRKLLPHS